MSMEASFFCYWGKTDKQDGRLSTFHLAVYHSLDVAAVAQCWLQRSSFLRQRIAVSEVLDEAQSTAWVVFFIALHDLGKFDIRFQSKVPDVLAELWHDVDLSLSGPGLSNDYWHGEYAAYWCFEDLADRFDWKPGDDAWSLIPGEDIWDAWRPWIRAVAGHHGKEPIDEAQPAGVPPMVHVSILERDRQARLGFLTALEELFLNPVGLSLDELPPSCDVEFLAGFCSVCDWLGSMTENHSNQHRFTYVADESDLGDYLESRRSIAGQVLEESGLLGHATSAGGMNNLYPEFQPQQVQTLVDQLGLGKDLTLIEAPTGSGKTEAALAHAARLLAAGHAESIIFALPTQATADAMLERLEEVAPRLFDGANLVLAHGKSRFNPHFIDLKKNSRNDRAYSSREQEAGTQCAFWLAQSRKRVFLGQIGVCTIDQVLISSLPVRHRFVRGFGLGRSVLIIDEVHAYDSYMYALLDKVLRHQKAMGSSAILLSATLPLRLRRKLLESWNADANKLNEDNPYPLITQANAGTTNFFELSKEEEERLQNNQARTVTMGWHESPGMLPDEHLERSIVEAACKGANVAVICNLVADAQALAERLAKHDADISLFHSRYRFKDRQMIQKKVMERWGKKAKRAQGGVLVATQVIEQSLDLDFDLMITQLCPIDLMFQRLGRLHRHKRARPVGFDRPVCTVLLPGNHQYELHKLIYGNGKAPNARVLWRTEQMVRNNPEIRFPDAYRPMIEKVYCEQAWPDEPDEIVEGYEAFWQAEDGSRLAAQLISNTDTEWAWNDDDDRASLLTRDGEMSLNIVPVKLDDQDGRCFLDDGRPISEYEEWEQAEQIMRNTLPAPASWRGLSLPEPSQKDGLIWLMMQPDDEDGWMTELAKASFHYRKETGLRVEKK